MAIPSLKIEDLRAAADKFISENRPSFLENPMTALKILGVILAIVIVVVWLAVILNKHRQKTPPRSARASPIDRRSKRGRK